MKSNATILMLIVIMMVSVLKYTAVLCVTIGLLVIKATKPKQLDLSIYDPIFESMNNE